MGYSFGFCTLTKMSKVAELEEQVFEPNLSSGWFDDMILRTSLFKFEGVRIAELNDRIVSVVIVLPKRMRIGSATVLEGGVIGVATHPDHRRKGLATRLLTDAISYMSEIGCPISTLGTMNPTFYQRLGWEIAQPSYSYLISRDSLLSLDKSGFEVRTFRSADLDEVMAIDQETNAYRTGSLVRSREDWEREISYPCIHRHDMYESKGFETFLVGLRDNRVISYTRCMRDGGTTHIMECGIREESCVPAILRYLAEHEPGCITNIEANLPLDNPLVQLLLRLGAKDNSSYSGHPSRGLSSRMVRIIDLPRLLESIVAELTRRISSVKELEGSLRLRVGEESVLLRISDRTVTIERGMTGMHVFKTTLNVMARIVMGHLLPSSAVEKGFAKADVRSLKLMDSLFPRGYPMHRSIDPLCQ
jgi:predicted acetyltransferase